MIVIFRFSTLIKFSCLHFGQYRGKLSSLVFKHILIRVLLLQMGHNIHSLETMFQQVTSFLQE